ncbi:MAG TPA: TM2 domain-containing protein [Marivirga sp.]|nr:TM2 domain-containing protein [Marivirga sp.]
MDANKVDMYVMTNGKFFEGYRLPQIRERLLSIDESRWPSIQMTQLKDPTISLILSLFVGYLGIDRFYVGDVGLGILKLVTCGGFGIWVIVDWFLIMGTTKEKNLEKLHQIL